jgi:RimJ/RimL family protein N-acetyltransferase
MTLPDWIAPETRQDRHLPLIETERLVLRAPRLEDAKTIATLVNDRRIAENTLRIPHPYGIADAQRYITGANANSGETAFLITRRDTTVLGACGIAERAGAEPEIGYWLAVAFWGEGYATEAARAVIDYAFDVLGYEVLRGGARVSNPASRRVLEKCGFQWTGVGLYRIRALASSAPVDRFRLDRGLWASLKSWGKIKRSYNSLVLSAAPSHPAKSKPQ